MYRDQERWKKDPTDVIRTKNGTFEAALSWKDPMRIFTCSWSDFFIEEADEWREDAWDIIRQTPHHIWQILTKRPERILEHLPEDWGEGWKNVWLGVSAENQAEANKRIPVLLSIPAFVHWVSVEPQLENVSLLKIPFNERVLNAYSGNEYDFNTHSFVRSSWWDPIANITTQMGEIDWVVIGGESGKMTGKYKAREASSVWFSNLIDEAKRGGAAVFMKQIGSVIARERKYKQSAGADPEEWPDLFRIQEMPKAYHEWNFLNRFRDRESKEQFQQRVKNFYNSK